MPWVRPIRSEAELAKLVEAAKRDNHECLAPTDIAWKGATPVGYGSLAAVPMMHIWVDSKAVRARESLGLLNTGEAMLAKMGMRSVIVPCWSGSPFAPYMEQLGYKKLGETTLYIKGI